MLGFFFLTIYIEWISPKVKGPLRKVHRSILIDLMRDASLATESVKAENQIPYHTTFSNCMEFGIFHPVCIDNVLHSFSFS